MTLTAVQELAEGLPQLDYRARVIYGMPVARVAGDRGTICLFAPATLVAYELVVHGRPYCFLFRTRGEAADQCEWAVAGVRPAVRLLISASTARRVERLKEFLHVFDVPPASALQHASDALLLRASSTIFRRQPLAEIVSALRDEP